MPPCPAGRTAIQRFPHRIVATSQSAIVHSAANELARGLHSMLGRDCPDRIDVTGGRPFILGTPAEIRHLLPDWKPLSPVAPEGFSLSQLPTRATTTGYSPGVPIEANFMAFSTSWNRSPSKGLSRPTPNRLLRPFAGSTSGTTSTAPSSAAMPGAASSSTTVTCART